MYWTEHKDLYETAVRGPMFELLAELAPEFGEGKVFRPYRDVRFQREQDAVQTNIGAMVGTYGYVHLGADGVAAGRPVMAKDQLDRYRKAVADATGAALEDVIRRPRRDPARRHLPRHPGEITPMRGHEDHPASERLPPG